MFEDVFDVQNFDVRIIDFEGMVYVTDTNFPPRASQIQIYYYKTNPMFFISN